MTRILRWLGAALALALVVVCFQPVEAATVALSINFTNGTALIGANTAGVDAYGNWNDMTAAGTFAAAGSMKLSDGSTATGVKVDGFANYGSSFSTGPSGGSVGDQALMGLGAFMSYHQSGGIYVADAIQISGLSNIFTNGYTVRTYQGWTPGYQATTTNGQLYVSTNAADFSLNHNSPGHNGSAYNTGSVVAGTSWGPMTNSGFGGNFNTNGFYATTGNIASSPDLIVLTNYSSSSNSGFSGTGWSGIQIVGEVGAVPEPSSFALAGLGFLGLGWFGYRRRRA